MHYAIHQQKQTVNLLMLSCALSDTCLKLGKESHIHATMNHYPKSTKLKTKQKYDNNILFKKKDK